MLLNKQKGKTAKKRRIFMKIDGANRGVPLGNDAMLCDSLRGQGEAKI